MHAVPICMPLCFLNYRIEFFCLLFLGSCTLHLVWREGGWAEFWCSTMQVQFFKDHAKCIHFTGIYSMLSIKTGWEVHNDIQLISKKKGAQMFTQCYSNLKEKKDKKGALIYVLAIVFSLLNMESLWLNTSWEGGCCLIPMPSSDGKRKWRRGSQYS